MFTGLAHKGSISLPTDNSPVSCSLNGKRASANDRFCPNADDHVITCHLLDTVRSNKGVEDR